MKNKEVIGLLNALPEIENLKLGGVRTKILLKNKKALIKAWEEVDETRKKIVEQYTENDVLNVEVADKEFSEVLNAESDVVLEKFNSGELDQFSDLTLKQREILELMTE